MSISRLLVVGGTGVVGQAVTVSARASGVSTVVTQRQAGFHSLRFDAEVSEDVEHLVKECIRQGITHAIFSFGQSGYSRCARDPIGTSSVNVAASVQLAKSLDAVGVKVCVISSSAVFSGAKLLPTELATPDPPTEYGRQKVTLEVLLSPLENVKILRLTKVVTPNRGLLSDWISKLSAGEEIRAFNNLRVAPISPAVAGNAIVEAAFRTSARLIHLSPATDMTYVELARNLVRRFELPGKVVPIEALSVDLWGVSPGGHAALGSVVGLSPLESLEL